MKGKFIRGILSISLFAVMLFATGYNLLVVQAESVRASLKTVIADCEILDSGMYTPKAWEKLQNTIKEVKAFTEEGHGTEEEAYTSYVKLKNAIVGLKKLAEKDVLRSTVHNAGYINKNDIKDASWKTMLDAIAMAKKVLIDPDATQVSANVMTKRLIEAQAHLERKDGKEFEYFSPPSSTVKKDLLYAVLFNLSFLNKANFDEFSWDIYYLTYESAEQIAEDKYSTQLIVDEIVNELIYSASQLEFSESFLTQNETSVFPLALPSANVSSMSDSSEDEPYIPADSSEEQEDPESSDSSKDLQEDEISASSSSIQSSSKSQIKPGSGSGTDDKNALPFIIAGASILIIAGATAVIIFIRKNKTKAK